MTTTEKVVRCHSDQPTPYLRDNVKKILNKLAPFLNKKEPPVAIDFGAGNGRNLEFLEFHGKVCNIDCSGFDLKDDHRLVIRHNVGKYKTPMPDGCVDILLCQYVLMFLEKVEREFLMTEINRVAAPGALLLVELFPAKSGRFPCGKSIMMLITEVKNFFKSQGWIIDRETETPEHFFLHKPLCS